MNTKGVEDGMGDDKNGIGKVFGTWPGDETDEQLLAALSEVRKPSESATTVTEPVAWMYRSYLNIGGPRESWELSEPRVTTDLEKTQDHPSGRGTWPIAEIQPLYLHPQPTLVPEVRGKASPEMEQLMGRLRREAFYESDWPVAVSRKDINALLDHIEGKG